MDYGYSPLSEPTTPTTPRPTLVLSSSGKALLVSNSNKSLALSNSAKRLDSITKKKYVKQVTGRHNDTELHLAAQRGDASSVRQILSEIDAQMMGTLSGAEFDAEVSDIRSAIFNEVNELGETALFTAAEKGHLNVVKELLPYTTKEALSLKNRSGFDPLHIAANQGHQGIVQVLLDHDPELIKTFAQSNATPLISASTRGHAGVVELLLSRDPSQLEISRANGKNALHFAARQGHVDVVKILLGKDPQLARRTDKKGQTALHMAAKGVNCAVVKLLLAADAATVMLPDKFGNTALHVATRKKRVEIVNELLLIHDTNVNALTRDHKTALDLAEGLPISEEILEIKDSLIRYGAVKANDLNQPRDELRKTMTQIKKDVYFQLEQTRKTNKNVSGIAKELRKLHRAGINNATNSVTVVAVLFATVAFAALFTVPGGDDDSGKALMVHTTSFKAFFLSNATALFTSLAVVVVQITVVRGETKSERRVVEVINKMMWLASVCTSISFIAASYIVLGRHSEWAAILVTVVGALIMGSVLGTMTYYVVKYKRLRRVRKKEKISRTGTYSWRISESDTEINPIYIIGIGAQKPPVSEITTYGVLLMNLMKKQLTGIRGDSPLHSAIRAGNLELVLEIISENPDEELKELFSKKNNSGETPLYVAAENGHLDIVKELITCHDIGLASFKARNGFDAFHIAAKNGNLGILKLLMEAIPEISMTVDLSNTTALHTAAAQGHIQVVNFLLENGNNLVTIAKSNGKTVLHSAARNGHVEVVKALLSREPEIATRIDKKGQTALHMAVKGQNLELVDELVKLNPSLANMVDAKGNTALHIATRKGRLQVKGKKKKKKLLSFLLFLEKLLNIILVVILQIVQKLLHCKEIDANVINKSGETALDTAEKNGHLDIASFLQVHGAQSAKSIKSPTTNTALELKRTVSDIKSGVHNQLENTFKTQRRMQGIAKRINKMHAEGLNNAITSNTVVAVLIATVAFAAIFTVPGQYPQNPEELAPGMSPGEANIAPNIGFMIFIIFDSTALFISLAVVVVQTSVIVIERKAKKQMMAVINKLMWIACVLISVAFLAMSYIVVGDQKGLAIAATVIGTVIMAATLGTLCYWVIAHRIEASRLRSLRSTMSSRQSLSMSMMSGSENEYKTVYAI
ncbi:uncharacterized protein LOC133309842 [Gastrolobium bilobum]|uniref:uncharacterized protein LOC133309842 n=1 Tax=Gastrolobium bilobum TaxID=150636 RepID=UPI002AB2096C|nr:uncharacterized protein LOC133309842 [Gastrolobium bilobum]